MKSKIPSSFEEFSRRDDLTRAARHGGWTSDQAKAFFPVVSQGEYIPSSHANLGAAKMQPEQEFIAAKTFTPGRRVAPAPWPKLAQRDDLEAQYQPLPRPKPY